MAIPNSVAAREMRERDARVIAGRSQSLDPRRWQQGCRHSPSVRRAQGACLMWRAIRERIWRSGDKIIEVVE